MAAKKKSRIHKRGFASMNKQKRTHIAGMGGRAAHKTGKAHEWTYEEAQIAGRLGGKARAKKNK